MDQILEFIRSNFFNIFLAIFSGIVGYYIGVAKTFYEGKQKAYSELLPPILRMAFSEELIQDEKDFWLDLLAIWILVILASIYGVLYFMQINNTDLSDTKIVILRVLSLIIFFKSIYSLYRGFRLDNLNRVPKIDVEKHSKGEIDNIVNNL